MDSLLVMISSSGISSMSVSWCPGWLKCCNIVSSVLFCIALRCSPNLSPKARLGCPMYSAGVFGVLLHLRHWIIDRLLDEASLASVFECTWWYTVFNEEAGFASDGVAFFYGRCVWSRCLCLFQLCHNKVRQVSWAFFVWDKGTFRKGVFASVWRLKYGQVFRDDLWRYGEEKLDCRWL